MYLPKTFDLFVIAVDYPRSLFVWCSRCSSHTPAASLSDALLPRLCYTQTIVLAFSKEKEAGIPDWPLQCSWDNRGFFHSLIEQGKGNKMKGDRHGELTSRVYKLASL